MAHPHARADGPRRPRRPRAHRSARRPAPRSYGPDPAQVYDVRLPAGPRSGRDRGRGSTAASGASASTAPTPAARRRPSPTPATPSPSSSTAGPACRAAAGRAPARTSRRPSPRCAPTPTCRTASVLVGHSAGGHLVVWAASQPWGRRPGRRGRASPACVDLPAPTSSGLGDGAVAALHGRHPGASCRRRMPPPTRRGSPAGAGRPVHGVDDDVVPVGDLPVLRRRAVAAAGAHRGQPARGRRVRALRAHRPRAPGVRGGPGCGRRARLLGWAP